MRLKLQADRELCIGAGVCVRLAPESFDQDEQSGLVLLLGEFPGPTQLDDARCAVEQCPSAALSLIEDDS